jgi:hypothetical protein
LTKKRVPGGTLQKIFDYFTSPKCQTPEDGEIAYVPIDRAVKRDKPIDRELIDVLSVLSI